MKKVEITLDKPHLKRDLGLVRATLLGIGGTISASGFVIIGIVIYV